MTARISLILKIRAIGGALCERAFFVDSTKYARSQTAPTVTAMPLRCEVWAVVRDG
jgi:hypothetical protein